VAALAALAVLAGCSTPEGDPSAYREEALSTIKAVDSGVQSVRLVLRLSLDQRTFGRPADDAVTTAESSVTSTAGTFTALQPPPGADDVRDAASTLLNDAQDAVAAARIAIRRNDVDGMRKAYDAASASARALERAPSALPRVS
jgi:hypothetical protein